MYLYAHRSFASNRVEALAICMKVGRTFEEIAQLTAQEDYLYLPDWPFHTCDEQLLARTVAKHAGLDGFGPNDNSTSVQVRAAGEELSVQREVAYWRKANAVHDWFVTKVQGGVDECQHSDPFPAEQLAHLKALCVQALTRYKIGDIAGARALMKPTSGFFFGGTEVDEHWAYDMRNTIDQVDKILAHAATLGQPEVRFVYHSSW